jgi:hypothetical protein
MKYLQQLRRALSPTCGSVPHSKCESKPSGTDLDFGLFPAGVLLAHCVYHYLKVYCSFSDLLVLGVCPSAQNILRKWVGSRASALPCQEQGLAHRSSIFCDSFQWPSPVTSRPLNTEPASFPFSLHSLICARCSRPPLPEERWEDPFGGFQQPAAGWREAAQDPPTVDQLTARGWLSRALRGLHPGGVHP